MATVPDASGGVRMTHPTQEKAEDMVHSGPAGLHTHPGAAKSVAEILNAAADLIEPEGAWTQGSYGGSGCWCAMGAINHVGGFLSDINEASIALARSLGFQFPNSIPDWNDDPYRTQSEVVAALRAAADKARTDASSSSVGTKADRPE